MAQISTTKTKRRTYSKELKNYLVEQALMGESSIASIAQGHGINPNLLHKWIRAARNEKTTLIAPQTSSSTPNHNIIEHQTSFLPVTLQPEPNQEQITPVTVSSPTLTGIQLQIPNDNKTPISLSIEQIDTYSLIELLRGLQ
ncbi:MAG: transposase [Acinetobacter sp.]|jgi:transposase-like protein